MPDDPDVQPSPEDDDPLAELQGRFSSSLDSLQSMLDQVADVLAPLGTLPELDGSFEGEADGGLASTLGQLAEPAGADPADSATQADGFDARQLDRAVAGAVDDVARSAASRAAAATALPPRRGQPPSPPAAATGGRTGIERLPLEEQQQRRPDSPLTQLIERQRPSSSADSSLDRIVRALAAGPTELGDSGATRVTFPQSPLTTVTSALGSGRAAGTAADSGAAGSSRSGASGSQKIPRPQFLNEPSGVSSGRGAGASGKSEQEMKAALERIERDVGELKRKPATWSAGR